MDGGSEGCWQQQCLQLLFGVESTGMGSESAASLTATIAENSAATETARFPSWPISIGRHPQANPLFATTRSATTSISTLNRRMRDSNVGMVLTTFRKRSTARRNSITAPADILASGRSSGTGGRIALGDGPARTYARACATQQSHE